AGRRRCVGGVGGAAGSRSGAAASLRRVGSGGAASADSAGHASPRGGGATMDVTRTEKRAAKGLQTLSRVPNASGLYSEMFMVEPTTECNLKCPLCPVPTHMHRPGIHMQQHTYREVVDD